MRDDVQRRLRGIAGDDELAADVELRKDCRNKRADISGSHHARCRPLRVVDDADGHRASLRAGVATPLMSSHNANTGANTSAGSPIAGTA